MTWDGYVSCTELALSDLDAEEPFWRRTDSSRLTSQSVDDGVRYGNGAARYARSSTAVPWTSMRDLSARRVRR